MAHAGLPQVDYRAVRARALVADRSGVLLACRLWACRCSSSRRAWAPRSGSSGVAVGGAAGGAWRPRSSTTSWRSSRRPPAGSRWSARCSATATRSPPSRARSCSPRGETGWYDYEAKYTPGGMQLVVPGARSPTCVRERVRELAIEAFQRAGCSGLARVDFFVERRAGAAQRAQHDARLHRDERVRVAVRGERRAVRRAARPAVELGVRAPRGGAARTVTNAAVRMNRDRVGRRSSAAGSWAPGSPSRSAVAGHAGARARRRRRRS